MTLDELKNLNPSDLASWPLPIKLVAIGVICLLVLGGGYWFFIQPELDIYEDEQRKEAQLRETFLNKKALAINLPAYKQQMEEMHQTFGSLLRQLPNSTEVENLLVDITQAGLGRGLDFVLFKPEAEAPKDFYAEKPISLQVTGSYHELALFISDVAALPRIVTFGDITITAPQTGRLSMTAKAQTYRYLEGGAATGPAKPARRGGR